MTTPASLEQQYTLATAVARYDELRMRDLLAPGHHGRGAARRGNVGVQPGGPPLPPLGSPVRSADQGRNPEERITYWCPQCQS